jgi:serine/threonine protein kinase
MEHLGQHDNIVSLRDVLFLPKETILIIDLIEGGELFDYIVEMVKIMFQNIKCIFIALPGNNNIIVG